jgi:hypothetical protein
VEATTIQLRRQRLLEARLTMAQQARFSTKQRRPTDNPDRI